MFPVWEFQKDLFAFGRNLKCFVNNFCISVFLDFMITIRILIIKNCFFCLSIGMHPPCCLVTPLKVIGQSKPS